MRILSDKDTTDLELLVYGMTLVNKSLNGIPDQDTYYDVVDALEEQDMESAIRSLVPIGNMELKEQCKIYEKVLNQEDAVESDDSGGSDVVKMR